MKSSLLLLPTFLLLTACGGKAPTTSQPAEAMDPGVEAVFSDTAPAGQPIPIPMAKTETEPGSELVLEGRIMGVMNPFVENRAAFILGDNNVITPCSDMPGEDHCETPWDACCDPNTVRQEGTATVQIVDPEGNVIRQGLEGVNGLEKLATVRVAGTRVPGAGPETLIVNASQIQVTAPWE